MNAYETCLAFELLSRVIVEVKSIERLERVHSAQLLSYLRFTGCHAGLLFNFNVAWLARDGLRRVVSDFRE